MKTRKLVKKEELGTAKMRLFTVLRGPTQVTWSCPFTTLPSFTDELFPERCLDTQCNVIGLGILKVDAGISRGGKGHEMGRT